MIIRKIGIVAVVLPVLSFASCHFVCVERGEYVKTTSFKYPRITSEECLALYIDELKTNTSHFAFSVPIDNQHYTVGIIVEGLDGCNEKAECAKRRFRRTVFPLFIKIHDEAENPVYVGIVRTAPEYSRSDILPSGQMMNGLAFLLTQDIALTAGKKYLLHFSVQDLGDYKITLGVYKRPTLFFPTLTTYLSRDMQEG